MPRGRESQEFHDLMLSITAGGSHHGPPISQGSSPSVSQGGGPSVFQGSGPSIFQGASPSWQSPLNPRSQPTAKPFRPAFGSFDKATNAELKEVRSYTQTPSPSE